MKTPDFRQEEGQSLIQVALMLVVLIGFVGLALDGGNLYAERRRMQNAADAGALAGAWAMCTGNAGQAAAIAADYMLKNGDPDVDIDKDVVIDGFKVTTYASKPVTPFLPFTFGGSVDVPASAAAACGAANKACGLWPVGLPKSNWDSFEPISCDPSKGNKIAISVKDSQTKGVACYFNNNPTPITGICNCYQCQYNNKPFFLVSDTAPGVLLDFSQTKDIVTDAPQNSNGCGVPELERNLLGTTTIPIEIGSCISQLSGSKFDSGLVKSAINDRRGDLLSLPLYGGSCGTAGCNAGGASDAQKRTIAGFGCATLDDVGGKALTNITLTRINGAQDIKGKKFVDLADLKLDVFFLTMTCDNSCKTSCGSTDGTPPDPNGINAVNLVP